PSLAPAAPTPSAAAPQPRRSLSFPDHLLFRTLALVLLVGAVVAFCLPWAEAKDVQLNGRQSPRVTVSQSGLQMIYGGLTITSRGKPLSMADALGPASEPLQHQPMAPVLLLYPLFLLLSAGAILFVWDRSRWLLWTGAWSGAALLTLQAQFIV